MKFRREVSSLKEADDVCTQQASHKHFTDMQMRLEGNMLSDRSNKEN